MGFLIIIGAYWPILTIKAPILYDPSRFLSIFHVFLDVKAPRLLGRKGGNIGARKLALLFLVVS